MIDVRPTLQALLVAALLVPSLASAMGPSGQPGRVVATVPIHGNIDLAYGETASGAAFVGWVSAVEEVPRGQLDLPDQVDRVRFELEIHRGPAASSDQTLALWLCDGPCGAANRTEASVDHAEGRETIQLEIPVHDERPLGWVVYPPEEEGAVRNTSVSGHALLLEEPADDPAQAQQRPSDPSSGAGEAWLRGAAGAGLGLAALAVHARLRRWWPTSLLGLYHRIDDDELLDHPRRREIHDLVTAEPGIHFSELQRRTDLATGNLRHHLHRMVDANLIEEHASSGYRCFFPPGGVSERVREAAVRVRSDTARTVLSAISDDAASTVSGLRDDLNVAQSTISYHVKKLADAGLVDRSEDGRVVRLSTTPLGDRVLDQIHHT